MLSEGRGKAEEKRRGNGKERGGRAGKGREGKRWGRGENKIMKLSTEIPN